MEGLLRRRRRRHPLIIVVCARLDALHITDLELDRPEVKELLEIPDEFITAAHVVAGYPAKGFPKKLTRAPVEETVFVDTFGNSIERA